MNQRQYNKPYTPKEQIVRIKRAFSINNRAQADSFNYNIILKKVSKKMLREIKKAGYHADVTHVKDRYILKIQGRKSVKMEVVK
ncbi:hypothetical protein [Sphingobacterium sp. UBA2074]|uniref:hypothetical protein n=1 Tax=Sphingobacterium sp. UBA2074 TaxID=1947487 RepID=UPI002579893B|nr:hypothetical protein [Sphingobacterium sp. UBA2074]